MRKLSKTKTLTVGNKEEPSVSIAKGRLTAKEMALAMALALALAKVN